MQAPRSSQVEIVKFLRGVTQRIEEEARRGVTFIIHFLSPILPLPLLIIDFIMI